MADDLLSQTDIDSLLQSLNVDSDDDDLGGDSGGGGNKYKIKMYDFKRQTRFAKDQLRTLQHIHENFTRAITTFFSTSLRYIVNMRIASQDQITYEEYIRSVDNPSLLCIFNLGTLEGKAIFEMNLELSFAILDRLLGGQGDSKQEKRKLSDIEEAVLNKIMLRILQELNEAWSHVVPLEPQFSQFESNPSFTQIVPPNDMVLLITFELSINNVEGIMNLCIPYFALEPIASKLSASQFYMVQRSEAVEDHEELIDGMVRRMDEDVKILLGKSELTYNELLNIQVGDVVKLDSKPNDELRILVGDKVKFKGLPGTSGKNMAVTITHVLSREDEINER
ncbi:MAG: flagellar motor switch protein FliM [Candidatus Cloacimonadota bacterium]|nr:MAG: flagellar motor switch protein FliM [Candidatus Cloacimonadota bacterium]